MNLLVVGGAGFIGSHLVDRLLVGGHRVDVVDDLSTGHLANLGSARSAGGDLKIHHLDVCSEEFVSLMSMREPDVVFHLGWAPPGRDEPRVMARAVEGVLQIVRGARATGTTKIVTAVPAPALYGEVPAREVPVKESRAWEPVGVRGTIARTVVDLLAAARREHAVEFTALALGSVYGPRQRPDGGVVAAFAAASAERRAPTIVGDGRQSRDFVHVDDVVDALERAGARGSGLVVNVGTGVATPINDLWRAIGGPDRVAGHHVPAPPGHPTRFALAATRARIHLAWAPWTTLDDGLRQLRDGR